MLELSASHADGAHPYNVPPEHTAEARRIMGPGKLLCPEVWVLLETDAATARAAARQALAPYMRLDNYVNNWRRLGFGDDEMAGGGSDRFVDANVAWGDEARDPQAHPGALGRRCRPCLHPDDQPRRLPPSRREGCWPCWRPERLTPVARAVVAHRP